MGYINAGKGLKTMFTAEIGAIVSAVIMIIPFIGAVVGGIGVIVFSILSVYGLYVAGKDFEGLRNAFLLTIVSVILSLLAFIPPIKGFISILSSIISLMVVYFVCNSLKDALVGMGKSDIAGLGQTVWTITLICTVLDVILSIIALIPIIGIVAKFLLFFVGIGSLVGSIMYLVYLYKCSNVF